MTNQTARVIRESPPGVTKQDSIPDDGPTPTHCQWCQKPLSEQNRKDQRGVCDDCRSPSGKMREIWVALECHRKYDQPIPHNIERLPAWGKIQNRARKRFQHSMFTADTWACLVNWLQDEHDINFEQFFGMTPEAVANRLREVVEVPAATADKPAIGEAPSEPQHNEPPNSLAVDVQCLRATLRTPNGEKQFDLPSPQVARWLKVLADHPGRWFTPGDYKEHDTELDGVKPSDQLKSLKKHCGPLARLIEPSRRHGMRFDPSLSVRRHRSPQSANN